MKIGKRSQTVIPAQAWIPTFVGMTVFLGLFSVRVFAEPQIQAKVSSTDISINDSITLSLEISGVKNIGNPGQLKIPGFQVAGAGRTQSFQFINGKSSSLVSFRYVLTPTKAGNLTIPAITLSQNNQRFTTKPINIRVTQSASVPSSPNSRGSQQAGSVPTEGLKPVFMSAKVNKSNAYVGEQILFTVQFLRRPNVQLTAQPRYTEPEMTGFLVEPLKQNEFRTEINGAQYIVTELRYALFPTSDGSFAIGNAAINLSVRAPSDPFNPNSFFDSFFGQSKAIRLTTKAIAVRVRALPKSKPIDFSGAVGKFKIKAKSETTTPEVGKPFNLTVTLEGVGNIKTIKEPKIPDLKAFRRYETIANSNVNNEGRVLYGNKEFKILMIPQVSGQVTIPSIPFTYFDPEKRSYDTIKTREISMQVKAGTLNPDQQDQGFAALPGQLVEGVRVVEKDIRFIKSGKVKQVSAFALYQNPFIFINSLPPIFAIGAALSVYRSRRRTLYAADYRSREALGHANKILKQAQKNIDKKDTSGFYTDLSNALNRFLSDRLGISATGLVWDDLNKKLKERNVSEDLRKQLQEILEEADMARFAPSTILDEQRSSNLTKTKKIISQIDKAIS